MLSKINFFLFPQLKSCLQVKEKKTESKHSNLLLSVLLLEQLDVRSTEQGAGLFELGIQLSVMSVCSHDELGIMLSVFSACSHDKYVKIVCM